MKRRRTYLVALCAVVLGLSVIYFHDFILEQAVFAPKQTEGIIFILDAGHGGEDGGALSVTGVAESGINLAISQKMDAILGLYGQQTILLRDEDKSLHDPEAVTLREKKVSDLKNRAKQINAQPHGVLISIHQNSYPGEQYWGLQTFYAPTEQSQPLAETLQTAVQTVLQPENLRQAKPIPDTVYLMNHVQCPAVLIECGFLTNREEEVRLQDDFYQKKLAAVLTSALLTWNSGTSR